MPRPSHRPCSGGLPGSLPRSAAGGRTDGRPSRPGQADQTRPTLRPAWLRPAAAHPTPVPWQQPGKGKKGKGRAKSHGKKSKKPKPEVDILSPAAMLNLYYIAHNVADCLYLRGFPWPGAPKGKKGKSKT